MESPMRKYCKALVNLAIAVIILLALIFVLPKVVWFFMPFVWGWVIAWMASPLVRFFEEKLKFKRKAGSAFVIIVVIGLIVLGLYLLGVWLVDEIVGLVNELPSMWESAEADLQDIGQRLEGIVSRFPREVQDTLNGFWEEAGTYIGDLLGQISSPTIEAVGNIAKRVPTLIIGVVMCLLSSYFFVAERTQVTEWLQAHAPAFLMDRYTMIKRSLKRSVGGYLKAQLKIEIWMYLLLVIGLSILGVEYTLLIACGIAILDFLPFFGTGTVMVPWAVIKILSGDYQMAIGLLIIWGVGQLARQIIQPKIVGDSIGVPPIPTLILLYVGYKFGGVIGMILAVPIGLLLYTLYQEGAFETTSNSLGLLITGINQFRKLSLKDMEGAERMKDTEKKEEVK